MDASELPELTEEWAWTSLEQTASIQGGIQKQPSRAPRVNSYPFLRVANVLRSRLDWARCTKLRRQLGRL